MKRQTFLKHQRRVAVAACGLLMGALATTSCEDDVLTGQPAWLGNSIYEQLQTEGNYTTVLRLIDDLGQHDVLSHTGSKTLFVADDQAYQEWFRTNSWGVRSYEGLSTAQKKLLLNSSMINNAYLIELLSNVSGNPPMEGMAMRRETSLSIYDSVQVVPTSAMPTTTPWTSLRQRDKQVPMVKDATTPTMIHLLPAFMSYNNFTNEDVSLLTNGRATSTGDIYVGGSKVLKELGQGQGYDVTCKNGYIHRVDRVIEPSQNMAEIMRQQGDLTIWSRLFDRFSAPFYNADVTQQYNRLYNNTDSVFQMRYFSKQAGRELETTEDGKAVEAQLAFDPGWNQYMYTNTMGYDLHYDAGVIIAPTDSALLAWWNGEGSDLRSEYHEWDSIPEEVVSKLLNVNMLPLLTEALPSKFDRVLNDAKEQLGIIPADVKTCFMGSNGVIYKTGKVFTPAEYSSVVYPALAHASTMNVIYWAIDQLGLLPYLLSMDSKYSLLLPTNTAMMLYVDPSSYGSLDRRKREAPSVLEFYFDQDEPKRSERVKARRYSCTVDSKGEITLSATIDQRDVERSIVNNRLKDLVEQLIIVGDIEDGHEYYRTKAGSTVKVSRTADGRLAVMGAWQVEHENLALPVNETYTKQNGRSYEISQQAPLASTKSLYITLKDHSEYSEFLKLLVGPDHFDPDQAKSLQVLVQQLSSKYNAGQKSQNNNMNFSLFDNYNYTVYVPENDQIKDLQAKDLLPTWKDYEDQTEEVWGTAAAADSAKVFIRDRIHNFIRYHVQDHSICVNGAPEIDADTKQQVLVNDFETMQRNPATGRFFTIHVDQAGGDIVLTDKAGNAPCRIVKKAGLYNNIVREYWFEGSEFRDQKIFMCSDAVVHLIDGALRSTELTNWKDDLNKLMKK